MKVSLLLKYANLLLLGLLLFISGCSPIPCDVGFSVDELPEAAVGQQYSNKIEILKGAMPNENNINWDIIPENTGITITRLIDDNSRNSFYKGVLISGIPKFEGNIMIRSYGFSYSSKTCAFDKTFTIKVNP